MKFFSFFSPGRYAVSMRLQVVLDFITFVLSLIFVYFGYLQFSTTDVVPNITFLTPKQIVEKEGPGVPVTIGLYIKGFPEFDIVKSKFTVDLVASFRFDPKKITIDQIDKFTFTNADVTSKTKSLVKIENKNIVVYYSMRVAFYAPLGYKTFPVDDHRLFFIMDNNFLTVSQVFCMSSYSDVTINPEISVEGWYLVDKGVMAGFIPSSLDTDSILYQPRIVFYFDFIRSGFRYTLILLLPLMLIFFTTLFSFSFELDPSESSATRPFDLISVSTSGLLALVAYRFVIETFSPGVGYFLISDYVFFYFLIALTVVLVVNALGTKISGTHKTAVVIALHIITNISFYIFFVCI